MCLDDEYLRYMKKKTNKMHFSAEFRDNIRRDLHCICAISAPYIFWISFSNAVQTYRYLPVVSVTVFVKICFVSLIILYFVVEKKTSDAVSNVLQTVFLCRYCCKRTLTYLRTHYYRK